MIRPPSIAATGLLCALAVGCSGYKSTSPNSTSTYVANMSGANESPAIATAATGMATVRITGSTITASLQVQNIDSALAAHIHLTSNGSIIAPLYSGAATGMGFSGNLGPASFTVTPVNGVTMDSLLSAIRLGHTYVNVHTSAHPAGEIRGALQLQQTQTAGGGGYGYP